MASRIKNFSIMGVHWKIRFLRGEREGVGGGGVHEKPIYRRGILKRYVCWGWGWVEGGSWYSNLHYVMKYFNPSHFSYVLQQIVTESPKNISRGLLEPSQTSVTELFWGNDMVLNTRLTLFAFRNRNMFKVNKNKVIGENFSTLVMLTLELSTKSHLPVVIITLGKHTHVCVKSLSFWSNQGISLV